MSLKLIKNKNIRNLYRGINGFNKGIKPRINIKNDDNGDPLAYTLIVLNR
jgi:hypothetical protein